MRYCAGLTGNGSPLFTLKDLNINLCGKQWFYIFYESLKMSGAAMIVKCFFIGIFLVCYKPVVSVSYTHLTLPTTPYV